VLFDFFHDQRQNEFLSPRRMRRSFKKVNVVISPKRSGFAVPIGAWYINGLAPPGENSMHAVTEFMRERHHIFVRSQIIQQRVGHRLAAGKTWEELNAPCVFFRNGHVNAAAVKKTFHNRRQSRLKLS